MIHLNNSIEFYPIKLVTFASRKNIHLKLIVLETSNQNSPIERAGKTIIDQIYISFITNGFFERHWLYVEEAVAYIINLTFFSINLDSMSLYERWVRKINLFVKYIKLSIRIFYIWIYRTYIYIGNKKLRFYIKKIIPTIRFEKLYGYKGIYNKVYIVRLNNR